MVDIIATWDSGLPGSTWDAGLQWDVNVGVAIGDISPYLALFAGQHRDKPKFLATAAVLLQPLSDIMVTIASMPAKFDVDNAVGDQLDKVGEWVGVKRNIDVPLTGVYFAFDTAGVGFDQGTWSGPFAPTEGVSSLSDSGYRTLLRARIAANQWDGTIPGAYEVWDTVFAGTGYGILIQDGGNMHMTYALTGPVPDAVTLALFTSGYLNLKPVGVKIDAYITPTVPNAPYFGFDVANAAIAGFDAGAWGAAAAG